MDMASELMDDAMEDMFEVDEGEADDLVNQVLTLRTLLCRPYPAAHCLKGLIVSPAATQGDTERTCTTDVVQRSLNLHFHGPGDY